MRHIPQLAPWVLAFALGVLDVRAKLDLSGHASFSSNEDDEGPCECNSFCAGTRTAKANPGQVPYRDPSQTAWRPKLASTPLDRPPPPWQQPGATGGHPAPLRPPTQAQAQPIPRGRERNGPLARLALVALSSRPRNGPQRDAFRLGAAAAANLPSDAGERAAFLQENQPLGPRANPGMYCNCHCNHDPWFWKRGTPVPFDWSQTPPPLDYVIPPPPCSGTAQEWPGCPAPMNVGGPVAPIAGLPGLPALKPVDASDLPTLGPVPTGHPNFPPPGPPPEPVRPPPPPMSPEEAAAAAAADGGPAGPDKNCVGPGREMIVCPPDPVNEKGWWGKKRPDSDVFYTSGADPHHENGFGLGL